MRILRAVMMSILVALGCAPAFAQSGQAFPQKQYYASDYGVWSIPSQQANTYLFSPPGICQYTPPASGQVVPFATNAPVLIQDASASNSEIVTPSSVTNTGSQCGITVSPVNNHYSFNLRSGTGGLQEALNNIPSSAIYNTVVYLDRNWYTAINSIAAQVSTQSAQAVIGSVAGSSNAVLIDNTTTPFTSYVWNGTKYVVAGSPSAVPFNARVTSYTAISAPTALSTAAATNGLITTATTGGSIPASSTYRLAITYVDASGQETTISTDSASTSTIATGATATNTISVTSPAAATGAVGWRLYMSAASGASLSEILYSPTCTPTTLQSVLPSATVCAIGSPATITAIVTGTATWPQISYAFPRTTGSSGAYPPFPALGTLASASAGYLGTINIPAGYLNTLGKSMTFCGNGFATTNGTGGTITLKTLISSIVGTTTITPFSVVSPSIAASAIQVPINFCETWTTAATGATGTLEVHGWVDYGVAGTAVGSLAQDTIFAVSSAIDLTKQDQIQFTITPTTAGLTAAQLRQLEIIPIN